MPELAPPSAPEAAPEAPADALPVAVATRLEQVRAGLLSDPAGSLALAQQVHRELGELAPPAWRAQTLRHLGLAQAYAGAAREALATLQAALAAVPAQDLPLRTQVERSLSVAYDQLGALDSSLHWAMQAAASARDAADNDLLAEALVSCGIARSRAGDAAGGLLSYQEALRLHETAGRHRAGCSVLNNMGINLKNLGRLEESVACLRRAEAALQPSPDPAARAMVLSNLGEPLWRLGRLDEAQAVLDAALANLGGPQTASHEPTARWLRAQVLHTRGLGDEARAELQLALAAARREGRRDTEAKVELSLSELDAEAGDHASALEHHRRFHALEGQQRDGEAARRIQALTVQADLAQARHEAEVYRLRHGEIAEAHQRLQALHEALLAAHEERSTLLSRLEAQSRTDTLTGLANRRHLDERLAEEFARSRRLGRPLAVAMCDLDNFKQINDRLGHAVGDQVLRTTAQLLQRSCRDIDLVARYGGEEFCFVFVEGDTDAARRACEAARQAVAGHDWAAVQPGLQVTLSVGIAGAAGCATHAELLAQADRRLYDAKRRGKNRVVL